MSVWRWLGLERGAPQDERREAVREIARRLEAMPPDRARFLALFAFLLARVASVDQDVSEEETAQMERSVADWGALPADQAALVVEIAKAEHRLLGETQGFLAAREFRDVATHEEKTALLHALFAVSGADDLITVPEEETVRQIARELLLDEQEYLAIRSVYRDKRAVLKGGFPAPGAPPREA
jgi:uncharacterized tellurite resistance protein B-like protein